MIRYFLLAVLLNGLLVVPLFATELTSDSKHKADIVLHEMEDSIMRINSGICKITGQTTDTTNNTYDNNFIIAFDYSRKLYRFDNTVKKIHGIVLTDRYYEASFSDKSSFAGAITSPFSKMKVSTFIDMVDVQAIPWFTPIGTKAPFDFQNEYKPMIFVHKILEYKILDDGLHYIKFDMVKAKNTHSMQMEYWLSSRYGYLPIRTEYSVGYVMNISWEQKNRTFVPSAYSFKSKNGRSVEWKIDWEQVNKPIPDNYFDPTQLFEQSIPLYTLESDDKLVKIGNIGKKEQPLSKPRDYIYLQIALITSGLVMIIIAITKMIYDRLKKKD